MFKGSFCAILGKMGYISSCLLVAWTHPLEKDIQNFAHLFGDEECTSWKIIVTLSSRELEVKCKAKNKIKWE
jgi:hypothetical protein